MIDGPFLWYLNRGSGAVTLVLFTTTLVLGVLSLGGLPARRLPRFVLQSLHRNAAALAFALLGVHIVSAVADEFVDIRWWHALVPYGAAYEPLWLGVGTVATDLILAVLVTTVVRARLGLAAWVRVHQLAYLAWALGLVHGLMIGTDRGETWALVVYSASAAVVVVAVLMRVASANALHPEGEPA